MSYQVLARKWRPRRFAEMVGQEHVLKALINALDQQRLHHAFLFTGTRGVGKTTIARILAKSLNCEKGISSQPCGECSACTEIDAGRFIDLIEVDAASRTKVDETRELLDNVQYLPARGRFKVYLIDEVHMLSQHSFNALLKTLEEPPPHVKFLLATTDPQRLPVTVLSRCLQFGLKRLPLALIVRHLDRVLRDEKVEAEPAAIEELARAADGSMRDALSLLDQAIPHGGGALRVAELRDMLGSIDRKRVYELLALLAADDAAGLLGLVAELDEHAPDWEGVLGELATALQRLAILKAVPVAASEWPERETLAAIAPRIDAGEVQLLYQIAITSRRDMVYAGDARSGFEMALLRMLAFRPGATGAAPEAAAVVRVPAAPVTVAATTVAPREAEPAIAPTGEWGELIERMALKGMVRELARNCALSERNGDLHLLVLAPTHKSLLTDSALLKLQEALTRAAGPAARLRIEVGVAPRETPAQASTRASAERTAAAQSALERDPVVQALSDAFGAKLDPATVRPRDE